MYANSVAGMFAKNTMTKKQVCARTASLVGG